MKINTAQAVLSATEVVALVSLLRSFAKGKTEADTNLATAGVVGAAVLYLSVFGFGPYRPSF